MVIAWMFFAGIGIVFARYFRFILPSTKICGVQAWFALHRPFMILATTLTMAGFILMIFFMDGRWIKVTGPVKFSHSIIGVVCVGFSFLQVLFSILT